MFNVLQTVYHFYIDKGNKIFIIKSFFLEMFGEYII
jgi:hypothetical protein